MTWRRYLGVRPGGVPEQVADYVVDRRSREVLERLAVDFEAVHADMSRVVKRLESDAKEASP